MLKVFKLTSTNLGLRPACTIGHKDVDQQIEGMIHSSPYFNCFLLLGLTRENKANKFADDPEFTIKAYLAPMYLANSLSNLLVI